MEEVMKLVDKEIDKIVKAGLTKDSLDNLYKLVDIRKDIMKEEKGEEEMRYSEDYGRRRRDSRGRYMEGGSMGYGRRGNYRGEDGGEMLERMNEGYGEYNEAMGEYNRGNYGAKEDGMESLEYMLQSNLILLKHLKENAKDEEEEELIKKYGKKIAKEMESM